MKGIGMYKKKVLTENEKKKIKKNLVIFLILFAVSLVILFFPNLKAKKEPDGAEFSEVNKICELATLRCYYHNVAEYEKQAEGLFKYGFKHGYKKMWMEYDGTVTVGIDVEKVQVKDPDKNGTVRIYVPDAQILSIDADGEKMSDPITETGFFTEITSEEKAKAFSKAQKTMRKNAQSDRSILNEAQNNAKELLKQYITKVGENIGQEYKVEWMSEPE